MIDNTIHLITTFYKSDDTKARAKEVINELTSTERSLFHSILKNKNTASADECDSLKAKLVTIIEMDDNGAFLPIPHDKDAALSPRQRIFMNVWRAIKDFFGIRISDAKMLKEICKFSENAALDNMRTIQAEIEDLLNEPPLSFTELNDSIGGLDPHNFSLDLTKYTPEDAHASHLGKFIEKLKENEPIKDSDYEFFLIASQTRQTFFRTYSHFGPPEDFTMERFVEKIDNDAYDKLSDRKKNLAKLFMERYKEVPKQPNRFSVI